MMNELTTKNIEAYLETINVPIVGVTKPIVDDELVALLYEHQNLGQYIYFGSTTIEQRQNFEAVFPVCKSIIVIGIPYNSINQSLSNDEIKNDGFVSNMAWEYDYHQIVKAKLKLLQHYLKEINPAIVSSIQVDTGPLIDRHITYRTGIGSYAKNQCIMHAKFGTEFYIGYLLVNVDIQGVENRKKPLRDVACEKCTTCVDLCPAQVLTNDFGFRGQRCISYLTQKKEHLNWDERALIGSSIYGCDICQLVCPQNKMKTPISKEYKRQTLNRIDLKEFLMTSNKKINHLYSETGFIWRGTKVLKRNAIIALGNQRINENGMFLEKLLENTTDYLTPYILWALYQSDADHLKDICEKILLCAEDKYVKNECCYILSILK